MNETNRQVQAASLVLTVVAALSAPGAGGEPGAEVRRCRAWVAAALLRRAAPPPAPTGPGLVLVRQDHGTFRRGRSVLDTPLRIGAERYAHGLGTHSISEITVRLPAPGKRFEAQVGIDNNHDTGGKRGSVVFVVDLGGRQAQAFSAMQGRRQALDGARRSQRGEAVHAAGPCAPPTSQQG